MSNAHKATKIIQRPDGSEIRITAEAMFGAGLHRSVDVYVHHRKTCLDTWQLANDRPHPDWRKMSVDEYTKFGRSEKLQLAKPGEILKVIHSLSA